MAKRSPSPEFRVGVIGVIVGLFAIALNFLYSAFSLISTTAHPTIKLVAVVVSAFLGVAFAAIACYIYIKNRRYLRGL